jgi:hypothetical protein
VSFGSSDGGARSNQRARGGRVALPIALHTSTGGMGYAFRTRNGLSAGFRSDARKPYFRLFLPEISFSEIDFHVSGLTDSKIESG